MLTYYKLIAYSPLVGWNKSEWQSLQTVAYIANAMAESNCWQLIMIESVTIGCRP